MIHGSLPRGGGSCCQPQSCRVRSARRSDQTTNPLPRPEQAGWGEWDASARLYEKMQARRLEAGETERPPWAKRIEDDTAIVPRAVAEQVCERASLWLREALPRKWTLELGARANVVYQHNARFRQLLNRRGDAGDDWLAAFMRHWLSALLASRRPDLYRRLPGSCAVGRELGI
jgi:hypothetical protein